MIRAVFVFLMAVLVASQANAACTSPAGSEGGMVYNGSYHTYQYCNGTEWVRFAAIDPGAGGGGCTNPAGTEGRLLYNGSYHVMQFCDGTNWMQVGGYASTGAPSGSAYFVVTSTQYNGNLGGLSGANAKCLTELSSTNTSWKGYTDANGTGRLTSTKVKAFLCDGTSCNNLNASTTYYFASTADSSAGGASFTTDASGLGPNDSIDWSRADHFGMTRGFWTNRNQGSATAWPSGPFATASAYTCANWSNATDQALNGQASPVNTGNVRWAAGNQGCSGSQSLVCIVNP